MSDAAQFVGVPLGAPTEVYKPTTACLPDIALNVDADAARALAAWIALGDTLLSDLRESYAGHTPSAVTLWPEHFDLACELGDADAGTRRTTARRPATPRSPSRTSTSARGRRAGGRVRSRCTRSGPR